MVSREERCESGHQHYKNWFYSQLFQRTVSTWYPISLFWGLYIYRWGSTRVPQGWRWMKFRLNKWHGSYLHNTRPPVGFPAQHACYWIVIGSPFNTRHLVIWLSTVESRRMERGLLGSPKPDTITMQVCSRSGFPQIRKHICRLAGKRRLLGVALANKLPVIQDHLNLQMVIWPLTSCKHGQEAATHSSKHESKPTRIVLESVPDRRFTDR